MILEGCGFNPFGTSPSYDEMSDAINTWEELTVTGVATAKGKVNVYFGVRGKAKPAGAINEPVDPNTRDMGRCDFLHKDLRG